MNKRSKWALIAVVIAIAALACFLWLRKALDPFADGPEKIVVPEFPYSEMLPGDLLFRTGTGAYSKMLNAASADTVHYSHIGLLVRIDSTWAVIHSVPDEHDSPTDFDRVKMGTVKEFFDSEHAYHGELVHTGFTAGSRMTDAALGFVRDSVRFDSSFDLSDSSRLYCTELIWLLYRREGIDLTEGRRSFRGYLGIGPNGVITVNDIRNYSGNVSYYAY